jgi:hypothetical protein
MAHPLTQPFLKTEVGQGGRGGGVVRVVFHCFIDFFEQEIICVLCPPDLNNCPGARPIPMRFLSTRHPRTRSRA